MNSFKYFSLSNIFGKCKCEKYLYSYLVCRAGVLALDVLVPVAVHILVPLPTLRARPRGEHVLGQLNITHYIHYIIHYQVSHNWEDKAAIISAGPP